MQALTLEGIRSLAADHAGPCLSLYVPTRTPGTVDGHARFEALSSHARKLLRGKLGAPDEAAFWKPADVLSKPEAWDDPHPGVVLFLAPGFGGFQRLPVEVPELVVVAGSFHIRPLLRLLETNQHYFLLTLGQNHVGFFKGSAEGLAAVEAKGMPRSLEEALGEETRERSVTSHYGARGDNPIYGGTGKADTSRDADLTRFFRAIDKAIWEVMRDEKAPLILAAPERDLAFYRSVSRYPHVAKEEIHGSFQRATIPDLHAKAWPIVQGIVGEREKDVLERYDRLVSRARALSEIRAIAKFAVQGRVRDLLLARDATVGGRLDKATGDVSLHEGAREDGAEDVLDDIAEAVLLRGGGVWSLEKSRMPAKSSIAATLRW